VGDGTTFTWSDAPVQVCPSDLEPGPPFRLDLTVWALRRRPDNAIDRWDGTTYGRVLRVAGVPAEVAVTQVAPPEPPRLRVVLNRARAGSPHRARGEPDQARRRRGRRG
jgi:hypothetical protein